MPLELDWNCKTKLLPRTGFCFHWTLHEERPFDYLSIDATKPKKVPFNYTHLFNASFILSWYSSSRLNCAIIELHILYTERQRSKPQESNN